MSGSIPSDTEALLNRVVKSIKGTHTREKKEEKKYKHKDKLKEYQRPCECCGEKFKVIGTASSAMAPISFTYCAFCILTGANPAWFLKQLITNVGGIEEIRKDLDLVIFNPEDRCYYDLRTGDKKMFYMVDGKLTSSKAEMEKTFRKYEKMSSQARKQMLGRTVNKRRKEK